MGGLWAAGRLEVVQAEFGLVSGAWCASSHVYWEKAFVTRMFWEGLGDEFVLGDLHWTRIQATGTCAQFVGNRSVSVVCDVQDGNYIFVVVVSSFGIQKFVEARVFVSSSMGEIPRRVPKRKNHATDL